MFLLSFFIINVCIYFAILLYNKLTCGINKSSRHLVGKVVIITGGNTGIGYETAKDLAARGAKVVLACRSIEKGTAARDQIINETENKDVHFKQLDLASFKSVRAFAEDILKNEKRLDILINNAGMYGDKFVKTEDGLLFDMQSNHFGPFLLTSLLLPLVKSSAPSRIINVSSIAYSYADLDLDNLNFEGKYNCNKVYSTTKMCNVLMTVELAKRLKGTGVTANSLHPGGVNTDILSRIPVFKYYTLPFFKPMFKTPWEGAQTTIYLAVSPDVKNVSGKYFSDCREKTTIAAAQNEDTAHKLWKISEKLVGIDK